MPEAKGKVKIRHQSAIKLFKEWVEEHPKASRKKRNEMFDFLVDTASSLSPESRKEKSAV